MTVSKQIFQMQISNGNIAMFSLAMWFVLNISTLILNKYIFVSVNFTYPVSLTAIHMLVCAIGSIVTLRWLSSENNNTSIKLQRIEIPLHTQIRSILPLAVLFSSNIVLGNVSLRWVPVSFMQTVKSSVPIFTVILQTIFLRKRFSRNTYLSMLPIVGGVCLASFSEVNYNHIGFYASLIASVISAVFAVVSGQLLSQQLDAINLLYYMAPYSLLLLSPIVLFYELPLMQEQWEAYGEVEPLIILLVSGVIAFLLNVSSFLVIKYTSPLTYTVSGNLKVILSITISIIIFRNQVSILNAVGCGIAVIGVIWYSQIRYEASKSSSPTSILPITTSTTISNNPTILQSISILSSKE